MYILNGIAAAPGIAFCQIQVLRHHRRYAEYSDACDPPREWDRFLTALQRSIESMATFHQQALQQYTDEIAKVYKAYLLMLQDEDYIAHIRENIFSALCAERAVIKETERLAGCLLKAKSAYLNQRVEDLRAIEKMLLNGLANKPIAGLTGHPQKMIIAADELTPADTIVYQPEQLQGFITCGGGVTSHSVILAKELGIPAIVGVTMDIDRLVEGQSAIVDGDRGVIYVDPDAQCIAKYQQLIAQSAQRKEALRRFVMAAGATPANIAVCANITALSEAQNALEQYADGIGLVRTEFLYMNRDHFPDEEEQFQFYRSLAVLMAGKEIVIRTLDIGGDKQADYIGIPAEENPFLGYRAVRYCLGNTEIFRQQLRAIVRASAFGRVKILIPMIATLEELQETKALIADIKQSLSQQQIAYDENIPVGIMVETPAAAMLADVFASHCDFFSIGSNDLTQYITASDRNNSKVQHLYQPHHPAVLRAIKQVVDAAKKYLIPVHVCGEIASNDKMLPFLIAAGVDELSVTPLSVPQVKYTVAKMTALKCESWLESVLATHEMAQIDRLLSEMANEIAAL
ncbi:phosphoenolpyruvate--protein phosphotransferase [Raoultella sp. WB_B2P2-3]|uniref:phosphoenolpyruvate--protein phosphotransferase n=1 Tax=Raoultella scottii TaxID=3040937 RepID=UPI002F93026D